MKTFHAKEEARIYRPDGSLKEHRLYPEDESKPLMTKDYDEQGRIVRVFFVDNRRHWEWNIVQGGGQPRSNKEGRPLLPTIY